MTPRAITPTAAIVLLVAAVPAWSCGYCDEDKIAAAYDHEIVERTFAIGHEVAFLSLDSSRPVSKDDQKAIRLAVESIPGVDRNTVRMSVEAGALSFAFDPRKTAVSSVLKALDRQLATLGYRASLLRPGGSVGVPAPANAPQISRR